MNQYVSISYLGKVPSYLTIENLQSQIARSLNSNKASSCVGELLLFELTKPVVTLGRREHFSTISPEKRNEYWFLKAKLEAAGADHLEVWIKFFIRLFT